MKLVNLQRYVPKKLFNGDGIQYFIDTTGQDWFKSLPKFDKKYSLAIENDTGVIRSISEDVSRLYPVGLTVVDVDSLPEGCDIFGGWVFDGEKIVTRIYTPEELQAQAESKKGQLITEANKRTQAWQTQLMLGMISDEDKKSLIVWMAYVQNVQAIDTHHPESIVWPAQPK